MISHEFFLSSAPVGSSQSKTSGSVIIALRIATLCLSPPDKFLTFELIKFSIFNDLNKSIAFSSHLALLIPCILRGKITFSKAVKSSNKL